MRASTTMITNSGHHYYIGRLCCLLLNNYLNTKLSCLTDTKRKTNPDKVYQNQDIFA